MFTKGSEAWRIFAESQVRAQCTTAAPPRIARAPVRYAHSSGDASWTSASATTAAAYAAYAWVSTHKTSLAQGSGRRWPAYVGTGRGNNR